MRIDRLESIKDIHFILLQNASNLISCTEVSSWKKKVQKVNQVNSKLSIKITHFSKSHKCHKMHNCVMSQFNFDKFDFGSSPNRIFKK